MHSYSQIRTPQGYLPFRSVAVEGAAQGEGARLGGMLAFDLRSPVECAAAERDGATELLQPAAGCDVVELGLCVESRERLSPDGTCILRGWAPSASALTAFACKSGPLFGSADGREALRDWGMAADAAFVASRIQECVNGAKPLGTLRALDMVTMGIASRCETARARRIQKTRLACIGAQEGFDLLALGISVGGGRYRDCLADLPLVQRVGLKDGRYLYAFAQQESGEAAKGDAPADEGVVGLYALSLPREISAGEFELLVAAFGLAPETGDLLREKMRIDPDGGSSLDAGPVPASSSAGLLVGDGGYATEGMELADGDKDMLEALVRMMILLHLGSARIDPFQGDPVTGSHSFDALVGWMWYGFSVELSAVKVGYCRTCGKAFSLVGSRGIPRRYCSDACKDSAKNERTREKRDRAREIFLHDGAATVERIAAEVYGSASRANCRRVRESLSQWGTLKHALDDEVAAEGFEGSALLRRCEEQGLDVAGMLSAKRVLAYQEFVRSRR